MYVQVTGASFSYSTFCRFRGSIVVAAHYFSNKHIQCLFPSKELNGVLGKVDFEVSANGNDFIKGADSGRSLIVVPDPAIHSIEPSIGTWRGGTTVFISVTGLRDLLLILEARRATQSNAVSESLSYRQCYPPPLSDSENPLTSEIVKCITPPNPSGNLTSTIPVYLSLQALSGSKVILRSSFAQNGIDFKFVCDFLYHRYAHAVVLIKEEMW